MGLLPDSELDRSPGWTLVRDIAVLQVKLVVDGLRDLILVPASLIAGILSLSKMKNGKPGAHFYKVVGIGKQSEQWINLFGALRNAPLEVVEKDHFGNTDIDEIVTRMESFVVDEYQRGGVTAQAKERIEKAIAALQRRRNKEQ
jgi:hypothetical protein